MVKEPASHEAAHEADAEAAPAADATDATPIAIPAVSDVPASSPPSAPDSDPSGAPSPSPSSEVGTGTHADETSHAAATATETAPSETAKTAGGRKKRKKPVTLLSIIMSWYCIACGWSLSVRACVYDGGTLVQTALTARIIPPVPTMCSVWVSFNTTQSRWS